MTNTLMLPPVAEGACSLERLRIYAFRNYAEQSVEFGPGINVVGGRNAQGKTNLLEAVATLLLTRSPRASTSADVVAWGSDEALVEARVVRPAADRTLAIRFRRDLGSGRVTRTATVDGSPRPARDLLGLCPVVLFWPEDLQLVKAGPDGRRRLLDVVLSQLDARAAADLLRYRHVLEQRNSLLRQIRAGSASPAPLQGFTRELVSSGSRIQVARAALVEALIPHGREALAQIGGGEELGLHYLPDGGMERGDGLEATEQALAATLRRRHEEEIARGATLAGPHRDDLELLIDGRPARSAASQGQQRSIVLALKLAEVRHIAARAGVMPVLLLDDVLSELDPGRRHDLLSGLAAAGLQTLITSSELLPGSLPPGTRRFEVAAGRVVAEARA
ncbi:MAG: DNA replication/repair protein RecF [Candidatus Dormibacteraeota bacterium]|uniref:DNA replication and repair protein RecF n=1 Tax=Candidatus Amunia macphersoniae TaxID=3127014 RepID=A0A934KJ82_9BACT|nr:DNA replication/repair protein RecF [Candidatus Dormibacteraeota bacterium]